MSTVVEIEDAMKRLPHSEKLRLLNSLANALAEEQNVTPAAALPSEPQSVLDIPAVSVGKILRPAGARDELLDEMLEDRI